MRETIVEKKLIGLVKKRGGMCLKFVSPGNAGVPDRIVLLPGGVARFVELKTDTGRPTPIQKAWLAKLRRLGFDAQVLYGAEEVKAYVTRLSEASGSEDS